MHASRRKSKCKRPAGEHAAHVSVRMGRQGGQSYWCSQPWGRVGEGESERWWESQLLHSLCRPVWRLRLSLGGRWRATRQFWAELWRNLTYVYDASLWLPFEESSKAETVVEAGTIGERWWWFGTKWWPWKWWKVVELLIYFKIRVYRTYERERERVVRNECTLFGLGEWRMELC